MFLLGTFCCVTVKLYILIGLLVVSVLGYAAVEYDLRREPSAGTHDDCNRQSPAIMAAGERRYYTQATDGGLDVGGEGGDGDAGIGAWSMCETGAAIPQNHHVTTPTTMIMGGGIGGGGRGRGGGGMRDYTDSPAESGLESRGYGDYSASPSKRNVDRDIQV